ncbi:ArnT family glycosyltransferase, partial [Microbacterium dextranolyticum]
MREKPVLPRWWSEPWWARLSLALIVVVSTSLTAWNLARGGDFSFYEASARSMSESWQALFFGAFDPGATVTLDKLSGFAVPQALSIRLFGPTTSALALPQLIEGVVTTLACAVVGLRWLGRAGGLVAAAAAAFTPIFVSMFGHPMEDGMLTMALAVALVWWQRAALTQRLWPLLLAGLFIGVGFQAKMMQAWFVLPALLVGTVLVGGASWGRRFVRAGILAAVAVVSSIAWILVIQLVPAASRPFVDGSTDNDVFAMVFGYNGIDRLVPNAVPGAVQAGGGMSGGPQGAYLKLLDPTYATQVGWLYPAAIAAIALGVWRWWPRRTTVAEAGASSPSGVDGTGRATFVVLTIWLLTAAGVLSVARMPHTAYLAAIGVQLALLTAFATTEALRLARSTRRVERAILPALIAVQGGWWILLAVAGRMPVVLSVPMCVLLVVGFGASMFVAAGRTIGRSVLAIAAAAALVAGPALFSAQVLDSSRDGSGGDASVGIRRDGHTGGVSAGSPDPAFAVSAPAVWGGSSALSGADAELLTAVLSAGGGTDGHPLFLTDTWNIAAPLIDATGREVLSDGGFSGQAQVFTSAQIRGLIDSGEVHLLVVKQSAPQNDPVRATAQSNACTEVRS